MNTPTSPLIAPLQTQELAALAQALNTHSWMLATAESCTGGLIAAACTDLPGSSAWFERGFVTYSNAAKTELLGVPASLIAQHGAVSQPVAEVIAAGAARQARCQVAVATTGIAGPTGGSAHKPVGTVWLAWFINGSVHSQHQLFAGDRAAVRQQATGYALKRLMTLLKHAQ